MSVYTYLLPFCIIYGFKLMIDFRFLRKNISGEVIRIIQKSQRKKKIDVLISIQGFFLGGIPAGYVLIREMRMINRVTCVLFLIEMVLVIILQNYPQKIYENGIKVQRGYIAWNKIQSVKESDEDDIIMIKSETLRLPDFEEKIYCRSEEKEELENYIRRRIEEIK